MVFRVCIVTSGPLGSNPRTIKELNTLAGLGYDVSVIATRTLHAVDRLDEILMAKAPWRAERLDFRARGNAWRMRRATQIAQATAFAATRNQYFADHAISAFTPSLIAAAKRSPADLYIAHYPGALPAAAIAARTHGATYAYDAEDFHPGDWPQTREFDSRRLLLRAVESRYLPHCAFVTAAAPGIADAYAETYGIARPTPVLNVFSKAEAPQGPSVAGTVTPGPSIYWFSQTIGPDRGLEAAVEAIGRARTKPHLYLRGSPSGGFREQLDAVAERARAGDRLHVLTPESPLDMVRLAAAYDIGLSSETGHTRNRKIALNNKLFTFILAGIPVLMSDIPAHRNLAAQAGRAVRLYPVDDAEALAAAIDGIAGDPASLADARAAAFQLGQERFNWDVEKHAWLEQISVAQHKVTRGNIS